MVQKEKLEKDQKKEKKILNPTKMLALMGPPPPSRPNPSPLPPVAGSYSVLFEAALRTYTIQNNKTGDWRWYPKRGRQPLIETTATGITIITDAEGGSMLASDLFGAGAID